MIFYFTATGNCLHVARELAQAVGDAVPVSIPQEMEREGALRYKDDAIGIVYPIYGHEPPYMVRQFLERAAFDTPYFFLVLTYGCRTANAVELALRATRGAGIEPSYVQTLLMVDNWLPNFDMDVQQAMEKDEDEHLAAIKNDVLNREHLIPETTEEQRAQHRQFLSRGIVFEPEYLNDFLRIDPSVCTGCGICRRVCPAGCIEIADGTATRDAVAGDGCNACLACIHACASHAIELPMGEVNPKARYRNKHVKLADIVSANER